MTKLRICKHPECDKPAAFAKKGYCNWHYFKSREEKPQSRISKISVRQQEKMARDRELWNEIWSERPHVCENVYCRKNLNPFLTARKEPISHLFSHRRSKGAAPHLRYDKSNIDLLCPQCHREYETGDRTLIKIRPYINQEKLYAISKLMGLLRDGRRNQGCGNVRTQQHEPSI